MMEWARPAALCIVAMTSACGDPGADDAVDPDAGNGDTTPPTIVSSVPADGERPVSVLADISVTFDEALDPATVSSETLVLRVAGVLWTLAGSVALDPATRTATFSPTAALSNYGDYELTINGVADVAGNQIESATITFHTFLNPQLTYVWHGAADGLVAGWYDYQLDPDGDRVGRVEYASPGLDAVWFTSDDEVNSRERYEFDADGHNTLRVTYDSPGVDAVWGNGDDTIAEFASNTYDSARNWVRHTRYGDEGVDLTWFTSDDVIVRYSQQQYDPMNQLMQRTSYSASGDDAVWFTVDDEVSIYTRYVIDSLGRRVLFANFQGPGSDAVWFTADDDVSYAAGPRYETGQTDSLTAYYLTYAGPGADAEWGTPDDSVAGYSEYVHEAGLLVATRTFDDPGIDQDWFTGDDHLSRHEEFSDFFAKGLYGRYASFTGAGPDSEWFTDDDLPSYYQTRTFDELGNVTSDVDHSFPGDDGIWFTEDDPLGSESTFDTTL